MRRPILCLIAALFHIYPVSSTDHSFTSSLSAASVSVTTTSVAPSTMTTATTITSLTPTPESTTVSLQIDTGTSSITEASSSGTTSADTLIPSSTSSTLTGITSKFTIAGFTISDASSSLDRFDTSRSFGIVTTLKISSDDAEAGGPRSGITTGSSSPVSSTATSGPGSFVNNVLLPSTIGTDVVVPSVSSSSSSSLGGVPESTSIVLNSQSSSEATQTPVNGVVSGGEETITEFSSTLDILSSTQISIESSLKPTTPPSPPLPVSSTHVGGDHRWVIVAAILGMLLLLVLAVLSLCWYRQRQINKRIAARAAMPYRLERASLYDSEDPFEAKPGPGIVIPTLPALSFVREKEDDVSFLDLEQELPGFPRPSQSSASSGSPRRIRVQVLNSEGSSGTRPPSYYVDLPPNYELQDSTLRIFYAR
ncbi:hypothetical protein PM082_024575 [Marasmius tenuissimus]|nr:hypothetical protein PM082_024575 [Marasmius tenuissimus]